MSNRRKNGGWVVVALLVFGLACPVLAGEPDRGAQAAGSGRPVAQAFSELWSSFSRWLERVSKAGPGFDPWGTLVAPTGSDCGAGDCTSGGTGFDPWG